MKKQSLANTLKSGLIAATMTFTATTAVVTETQAQQVKNVVLVHGAFADGSGYRNLYTELTKKGYNVTVVQNPLSSLEADVAATKYAIDRQDGPVILAGHSWGGVVITEAGNHPKVAGLVYIAALQPDKDESGLKWIQTAPPAPENGITAPDENGIVYFEKSKYHAGFAADIPKEQADFMYASQGTFYAAAFATPVTNAAWRTKPSFGIVATEDKAIVPEIQRNMYKRSNTKITEIKGSHVVFISQPAKVAAVIIDAAKAVSK